LPGEVVYIALGIGENGYKEVLGFWIMGAEGESAGHLGLRANTV